MIVIIIYLYCLSERFDNNFIYEEWLQISGVHVGRKQNKSL